jgi:hypothetical protein
LVYFVAIRYILWLFGILLIGCSKKNLATLVGGHRRPRIVPIDVGVKKKSAKNKNRQK